VGLWGWDPDYGIGIGITGLGLGLWDWDYGIMGFRGWYYGMFPPCRRQRGVEPRRGGGAAGEGLRGAGIVLQAEVPRAAGQVGSASVRRITISDSGLCGRARLWEVGLRF